MCFCVYRIIGLVPVNEGPANKRLWWWMARNACETKHSTTSINSTGSIEQNYKFFWLDWTKNILQSSIQYFQFSTELDTIFSSKSGNNKNRTKSEWIMRSRHRKSAIQISKSYQPNANTFACYVCNPLTCQSFFTLPTWNHLVTVLVGLPHPQKKCVYIRNMN